MYAYARAATIRIGALKTRKKVSARTKKVKGGIKNTVTPELLQGDQFLHYFPLISTEEGERAYR
jgi:hypothetical protein